MNEKFQIRLLRKSIEKIGFNADYADRINQIVNKVLSEYTKEKFFRADVKVANNKKNMPSSLTIYLFHRTTYLLEVHRVTINDDFEITNVEYNVSDDDSDKDEDEQFNYDSIKNDALKLDFVVGTAFPEVEVAKETVEYLNNLFINCGYNSLALLGEEASTLNYKTYLTNGLKGFVNIGHGNTEGIMLEDGMLTYKWFESIKGNQLAPAVIYFNSCQVFNYPLQGSIMDAGARTFIGGIVNLQIGPSEKVCKCFWNKILIEKNRMDESVRNCEKEHYPDPNSIGISGDKGTF